MSTQHSAENVPSDEQVMPVWATPELIKIQVEDAEAGNNYSEGTFTGS